MDTKQKEEAALKEINEIVKKYDIIIEVVPKYNIVVKSKTEAVEPEKI